MAQEARRAAPDRHARQALRARLGEVGQVGRRGRQVRPDDARDARGHRDAQGEADARLPRHAPLPHRLADHRHPQDQGRHQRGGPRLRQAAPLGRRDPVPEPRRRPRRRLRRQQDLLRLLDELHGPGVRQRRRLQHQGDLRGGGRPGADARHRVGPRRDRLPLGARLRTSSTSPTGSSRTRRVPRQRGREPTSSGSSTTSSRRQREERARVLPRRPPVQGGALHALQPRLPLARGPLQGGDPLLAHLRADPQAPEDPEGDPGGVRGPRDELADKYVLNFSVFQSLPDSGRSTSSSRSCRSTASASSRPRSARSPTSPATRTARSRSSSTCATSRIAPPPRLSTASPTTSASA